jgi:hypothetical protein
VKPVGLTRQALTLAERQHVAGRFDVWTPDQFVRELGRNFGADGEAPASSAAIMLSVTS